MIVDGFRGSKVSKLLSGLAVVALGCASLEQKGLSPPGEGAAGAESGESDEAPAPMAAAGGADVSSSAGWCEVRQVLQTRCQRCHDAPPSHGAPFALVSYEDTQVANAKGKSRFEAMAATVRSGFMPPAFIELDPQVELLTEPETELLLRWCADGAPFSDGCAAEL